MGKWRMREGEAGRSTREGDEWEVGEGEVTVCGEGRCA